MWQHSIVLPSGTLTHRLVPFTMGYIYCIHVGGLTIINIVDRACDLLKVTKPFWIKYREMIDRVRWSQDTPVILAQCSKLFLIFFRGSDEIRNHPLWSFFMLIVGRDIKFVSDMEVDLKKLPYLFPHLLQGPLWRVSTVWPHNRYVFINFPN